MVKCVVKCVCPLEGWGRQHVTCAGMSHDPAREFEAEFGGPVATQTEATYSGSYIRSSST